MRLSMTLNGISSYVTSSILGVLVELTCGPIVDYGQWFQHPCSLRSPLQVNTTLLLFPYSLEAKTVLKHHDKYISPP